MLVQICVEASLAIRKLLVEAHALQEWLESPEEGIPLPTDWLRHPQIRNLVMLLHLMMLLLRQLLLPLMAIRNHDVDLEFIRTLNGLLLAF